MALHIVREGEGEEEALPSLVARLRAHHRLDGLPYPSVRHCSKRPLLNERHVVEACNQARAVGHCEALILTRDADNTDAPDRDCPKSTAPQMAEVVRGLALPFPVAIVLFYKEYETLFVAGASAMAGASVRGRSGEVIATVSPRAASHPDPEHPRDAKLWVRRNLLPGYKPSLHQASLTRLLEFDSPELQALSSHRRLVNGLSYLAANLGAVGAVYPRPPEVEEHA